MKKYELLKLFLSLKKSSEKGLSLIELIVALVMSGIVLTMAASGFVNVLRANQDVESKSVRSASLQRALAFIQEDIKQGKSVTMVSTSDSPPCPSGNTTNVNSPVSSTQCLKITLPNNKSIYYGFDDISNQSITQIYLKPGILKRYDENETSPSWEVVMDGLVNTTPSPAPICNSNLTNTLHGTGGFRFCVETTRNRLAQVFLFGYVDKTTNIPVNVITFARSE